MSDPATILKRTDIFDALPPDELATLADAVIPRTYPRGQIVMHEGASGDSLIVVASGDLDVVRSAGTPDERVIDSAGPGGVLGEMSLFVNDGRRTASVRCRSDVELLELPYNAFSRILARHPRLSVEMARTIAGRLLQTDRRTIGVLRDRNQLLAEALDELQAAQRDLIEMEKLEHELRLARRIQQQLLPHSAPELHGWDIVAHWEPASGVSGDFYDFIALGDGRLGIVLGDVARKGIPAALIMATTRAVIRATTADLTAPEAILSRVNNLLAPDMTPGSFVTCLLSVLDLATGRIRLANARQCLPFVHMRSGVAELRAKGMPLGLIPGSSYEAIEAVLNPGDALVFTSDGLIEARMTDGEFIGVEGVRKLLEASDPLDSPIPTLLSAISAGGIHADRDDVTIVNVRRL